MNADKQQLRNIMRKRRDAVSSAARDAASAEISIRLEAMVRADPVAVYLATPREIDLSPYIRSALARGIALVAPRWNGRDYDLARLRGLDAADLRRGPMRVPEPAEAELVDPSAVRTWLVPGLAFTAAGGRLGYGGGWYDRLLARADPASVRIGIGYRFQIVPQLPIEPHDRLLSSVVSNRDSFDTIRL